MVSLVELSTTAALIVSSRSTWVTSKFDFDFRSIEAEMENINNK